MYQAYKYRIYPTHEQQESLAKAFGCCRWFGNYSLSLCQETYKSTGKGLLRKDIQGLLPQLKKEHEWLGTDVYSQCLQVVALNLSTAYKKSIHYPQNVKFDGDNIILPKIGKVHCVRHRDFEGTRKTVTISLNPDGKYYASVLVDDGKETITPSTEGNAIGIDLGLTHFCITSNGSKYDNPRHIKKHEKNLKRKQKKLSRKVKGSNKRKNARKLVAKVHGRIARSREDFLHKLSRKVVNENQVLAVENLAVKNMVKNHNLAKAISDCGWGMFCTMLSYKAKNAGKTYVEVDRFYPSSKTCNICLNQVGNLPLDVRQWQCKHCKTVHDRDVNAAINIRNEGLRILSLGTSDTAHRGNVRRADRISVLPERNSC